MTTIEQILCLKMWGRLPRKVVQAWGSKCTQTKGLGGNE